MVILPDVPHDDDNAKGLPSHRILPNAYPLYLRKLRPKRFLYPHLIPL